MFDKVNKKALIGDLAKVATFNLVAHFLMHIRFNEPILSEKFIYSLVFILLGFATYHYLLDAHVNKFFDVKKDDGKKTEEKKTEEKKTEEKKKETYRNYYSGRRYR